MRQLSGKAAIRTEVFAARRQLPPDLRQRADEAIVAGAAELVRIRGATIVAGYSPLPAEPGGPDLPAALAARARLLLPVLRPDRDLDWTAYGGSAVLLGVAAIGPAQLIFVPAVAVDRRGVRLGRGGGSYDRALLRVGAGALVVALCYAHEVRDQLPAEPHDQRVAAALTPDGLVPLG